jgi:signal transduction histidine kinase
MARLRLQTQLLISTLLIICALTGAILLIVRHTVRSQIAEQVRDSTAASLREFENVQHQLKSQLSRTAALLAVLPTLKALMTSQHAPTIQDGSIPFWKLAGSDLFLLADPGGKVMGLHVSRAGLDARSAGDHLAASLKDGEDSAWWYAGGRLYWVFLRPITAGAGNNAKQLGLVAVGYEVDSAIAEQLALSADSKIVLAANNKVIASTFPPNEEIELQHRIITQELNPGSSSGEVVLGGEDYRVASVDLYDGPRPPVQCYVFVSLGRPIHFINELNRTIFVVGVSAVFFALLLLRFVSGTITRPLDNLVAGVRALAAGDYTYSITPRGSSEVAELGESFSKMRGELLAFQRKQIETERVAALGRAASSISHDLRHHLAALVANAEFLYEAEKLKLDRDDIYGEIRAASEQITELLDSLRDLASERRTVSPVSASIDQTIRRAIEAVQGRPELRNRSISISATGDTTGVFDPKKLERAFFNLALNACEATDERRGRIAVDIFSTAESFEIRFSDNGSGIPSSIRSTLFDPFVSSGKSNGTGLGLAIVSKIIHDHGGTVTVEQTSEAGTVFLIKLPRSQESTDEVPQRVAT